MKHSILRKIDINGRQSSTNKTKMRKKMGCLYVADVYSDENLHAIDIQRTTPTVGIEHIVKLIRTIIYLGGNPSKNGE